MSNHSHTLGRLGAGEPCRARRHTAPRVAHRHASRLRLKAERLYRQISRPLSVWAVGPTRVRDLVSKKLCEASKELDVLAAKDGRPFGSVQVAFEKLEKAVKAFETM